MRHVIYSVAKSTAPAGKIVYLDTWYDLAFHYFITRQEIGKEHRKHTV